MNLFVDSGPMFSQFVADLGQTKDLPDIATYMEEWAERLGYGLNPILYLQGDDYDETFKNYLNDKMQKALEKFLENAENNPDSPRVIIGLFRTRETGGSNYNVIAYFEIDALSEEYAKSRDLKFGPKWPLGLIHQWRIDWHPDNPRIEIKLTESLKMDDEAKQVTDVVDYWGFTEDELEPPEYGQEECSIMFLTLSKEGLETFRQSVLNWNTFPETFLES
tara:strand:- start:1074 stop:1733 length:660 start_codon:yes stop_codon:yes gene_type:complete